MGEEGEGAGGNEGGEGGARRRTADHHAEAVDHDEAVEPQQGAHRLQRPRVHHAGLQPGEGPLRPRPRALPLLFRTPGCPAHIDAVRACELSSAHPHSS